MLSLSVFILGVTSVVTQVVLTRELLVSFYGNEFFIGWILFAWLFWVGTGSLLTRYFRNFFRGNEAPILIGCHSLAALLFPLDILLVRLSKSFFTVAAGQIPDLLPSIAVSFFIMAPLCLILGIQFTVTCQCWMEQRSSQDRSHLVGRAYLFETLGFVFGGLVFSYGLVFLNEFKSSAVLIALNALAVFVLLTREKQGNKKYFFMAGLGLVSLSLICFWQSEQLNILTTSFRFPNEKLLETKNTVYGNLAVTRTRQQINFYQNGLPAGADQDDVSNEYLVHFPMLSHPDPQKVLLVGTGFNGALREILKYHPAEIFYAELDPALIGLAYKYIPVPFGQNLDDGKVRLIKGDFRYFMRDLPMDLDVIIINLPNPSTALINRYFTDEFFREVRSHLKPDGVLSSHLVFSPDAVSVTLENLGASIYKTMKNNFSSVVILPEDTLFMMASTAPLTQDPEVLIQRLRSRDIRNYFVGEPYILYRYTTDRIGKVKELFEANKTAARNSDLHPKGYLYNLIYWFSIFHRDLATLFASLVGMNYLFILCFGVLLILSPLLVRTSSNFLKYALVMAMAMGGFSLMSAEVLVIYFFQIFYGNLYYKIAWIISAFMAGLAAGTLTGNKRDTASFAKLAKLHAGIGIYFLVWLLLLRFMAQSHTIPSEALWIVLALCLGMLIGLEFSFTNHLLIGRQKTGNNSHAGMIYAADLLGSCLGALLVGIFMMPAYGVYKTLLFLFVINFALAVLLILVLKTNPAVK